VCDVAGVVGEPGHQDEPKPHRSFAGGHPPCELQRGTDVHPRELAVALRVPTFDVEQHEIDRLELGVADASP
jgi:hypothetical protein